MRKKQNSRQAPFSAATAAACALLAAPAHAADSGSAPQIVVHGHLADDDRVPTADKTGTPLADLPASIAIIDRATIDAQGGVSLQDAIGNAGGIGPGGGDSFGFYDHFLIRGLDARIYSDGFSDGDQRNGLPHSLNGVARIEILKGPGSALFGSGPPGGTIDIVHALPSEQPETGASLQFGSFATIDAEAHVTGPTGVAGLSYRVDGLAQSSHGFRGLASRDDEIRPELAWRTSANTLVVSLDVRSIAATPDPTGIVYFNGRPVKGVSRDARYGTPFSRGDQQYTRLEAIDTWTAAPFLTVTNRFSYLHRTLSLLRNGDGGTVTGDSFTGRQLRRQQDALDDFDYQFEPLWRFDTGAIHHHLLTGFALQRQHLDSDRATADLPAIADIFAPLVPETSTAGLAFLRDAKHSGFVDTLAATYVGLYATDQIDIGRRLKVRLGARQDWFDTSLAPHAFVPGRLDPQGAALEPGMTEHGREAPLSWNAGLLYKLAPGISPYFGVSRSHLVVFSSEATQSGLAPAETGLQYEAGLKISALHGRVTLTGAWFDTQREHVFQLVGDTPVFNAQRTQGGEIDLDLQPGARWRITANATVQSARITDNPGNPAVDGNRPQGVPARIAHLWTSYRLTGRGDEGLRVGAGVEYRSRLWGDIANTNSVPGYVRADARIAYDQPRWSASVGVRNLSDADWFVAANSAGALPGAPRTFYASLKWRIGA